MSNFKVVFYKENKSVNIGPIEEFLNKSNTNLRVKILRQLQYLQEFGINRSVPSLKKLSSTPFWELRVRGKQEIRVICCIKSSIIYIIHIFHKKSRKTPLRELKTMLKRHKTLLLDK